MRACVRLLRTTNAYKVTKKKTNMQIFFGKNCVNMHFLYRDVLSVRSGLAMQGNDLLQSGGVGRAFCAHFVQFFCLFAGNLWCESNRVFA